MNCGERGSALVVVLVLLSGLGALALAAAAAAMTALALAGHQQMAQNAFEAAEAGIVNALLAAAETRRERHGCGDDSSRSRYGTRGISHRDSRSRGAGHASGWIQHRRKRRNIHCEAFFHHCRCGFGPRRQGATRTRLLPRGACLVNMHGQVPFLLSMALLVGMMLAPISRADLDEAWLHRAQLPDGVSPLLGIILDRSAATSRSMSVDEPYDPLRDYGAVLPAELRCDPAKAYWRRGPGPAPDCGQQAGLDIAPHSSASGLQCECSEHRTHSAGLFCRLARSPMECGCGQRQLGCAATRKRGRRRMPRRSWATRCDAWQLVCKRRRGNTLGRRSHARDRLGPIATRRSLHLLCREHSELPSGNPCDS